MASRHACAGCRPGDTAASLRRVGRQGRRRMKRIAIIVILLLLAAGGWWWFHNETRQPVAPSASKIDAAALKDPALIAKGEYLTIIGDCASCHTTQGGPRYAGGR